MRIFGDPERTKSLLAKAGMREGEAIESKLLTRQIERAQRKVEAHNFDIRKNLLEYDDVANDQRKVIYHQRSELMAANEIADSVTAIRREVVESIIDQHIPPDSLEEQWDPIGTSQALEHDFGAHLAVKQWLQDDPKINQVDIRERCIQELQMSYEVKVNEIGEDRMRHIEKEVMLMQLDHHWKEHLAAMDYLRQGIHLRGYAQKNPKQEYKREAFEMFGMMLDQVKNATISILSRVKIQSQEDVEKMEAQRRAVQAMEFQHAKASALSTPTSQPPSGQPSGTQGGSYGEDVLPHTPFVRGTRKIGRNEPCPCGSGKKYKQCHGKLI